MRRLATTTWLVSISLTTAFQFSPAFASDIVWEVQNPFRFFKKPAAFAMHEKAFDAVRGKADSPLPGNIVWRTERRLNDPDCADKATPARCEATARKGFERSRLGWAAHTLDMVCYERHSRPFRYPTVCERQYSWGKAKEDYVLPDAHTDLRREMLGEDEEGLSRIADMIIQRRPHRPADDEPRPLVRTETTKYSNRTRKRYGG
jgi:hypothetical protein